MVIDIDMLVCLWYKEQFWVTNLDFLGLCLSRFVAPATNSRFEFYALFIIEA